MAYRINEYEKDGIPADIIELHKNSKETNLILKKGFYKIIVKNKDYKITNEFVENIK
ncbi:hypothetical protein D3C72_2233700 [compost metagenome]